MAARGDAALPPPEALKSKGFTLRGALSFAESRFGPTSRERIVEGAPPVLREVLATPVLASAWYPFAAQVALYETIDRVFGRGDLALCRECGRFTAEAEATALHKLILRFASLEAWLRAAGTMWSQYYSAGRLTTEGFTEGGGRILITDFNPISRAFCEDLAGWFERTAELSGKKVTAVVHEACLLTGHPACVFRAQFRP
jgi:hypothetical protein